MKNIIFIVALFFMTTGTGISKINGDTLSSDNLKIIKVWGTHEQRGYAYGFLLAEQIAEMLDDYIIQYGFSGNLMSYEMVKSWFKANFEIEDKYKIETQAILNGIKDAGFLPRFKQIYLRDPDAYDLIAANAIVELATQLGCSALASWGESTQNDPELNGELIITRNLDWEIHPALYRNSLLTIAMPSEPDEQNWVSIGYCGLIGALSGMNESRVGLFLNVGNVHLTDEAKKFHPVFFATRNGLEMKDYNGDGRSSTEDLVSSVGDRNQMSGFIINVVNSISAGDSAIVIECNAQRGISVRTLSDNTYEKGKNLIATNHFRKLYAPESCYRYAATTAALSVNSDITVARSWEVLTASAGIPATLQTMSYIPSQGWLRLSLATPTLRAYQNISHHFLLDELFDPSDTVTSVEDYSLSSNTSGLEIFAYPNPAGDYVYVKFREFGANQAKVSIYNNLGKKVLSAELSDDNYPISLSGLPTGVYQVVAIINGRIFSEKLIVKQ